jgi:hypothetical protein
VLAASREALAAPRETLHATIDRRRARPRSILIARSGVAAALAYLVALHLQYSSAPILAPLTAVLVVQATLAATFLHAVQRLTSVAVGVLLGLTVSAAVGLTWWSLGALVAASLAAGKLLRLGANVVEVPVTAMLILGVHAQVSQVNARLGETLVGTLIGIAANLVLVPPVYLEPSVRAVRDFAAQVAEHLLMMSWGLRDGCDQERTAAWLAGARALDTGLEHARAVLEQGEQSARYNVRGRAVRPAWAELRESLEGKELVVLALRGVCRSLADRHRHGGAGELDDAAREALAATLEPASEAVLLVAPWLIDGPRDPAARPDLAKVLQRARCHREELRRALVADAVQAPQAWQANGNLLALLDQLLRELETVAASRRLADEDEIVLP